MSETGAIVFEVGRLIDQDSFYARLDGLVDDIESRLKDGTRKADLEWEIEDLKNDMAMLKPKERPKFRTYMASKYPRTAKLMGWRAA